MDAAQRIGRTLPLPVETPAATVQTPATGSRAGTALWLAIRLPALPLEVFPHHDAPIVVHEVVKRQSRVLCADRRAHAAGIMPGMPLGSAHALTPNLVVHERDPDAEQATLERLAAWCGQFSPRVSLEPPGGIVLEAGGSLKLFGGIEPLTERIRDGLAALGHRACVALAPTPAAATLLASAGHAVTVTSPDALPRALARVPLRVLPLDERQHARLAGMGLHVLGDLMRLPRDGLAKRTDPALVHLLDRALGRAPDARKPFQPPARFASRVSLPAETIDTGMLLAAAEQLLEELAGSLRGRGGGVTGLTWHLVHGHGFTTRVTLELVTASRDVQHLRGLLAERLERVHLPAPVRELGLTSDDCQPLPASSVDAFANAPAHREKDCAALLERLGARLGREAVNGIRLVPEHRPEKAWALCPPGTASPPLPAHSRPLWLLEKPLPLDTVAGRPYLQTRLVLEEDAERIESGWWDGHDTARDYFIAHGGSGEAYWVYRDLRDPGRWYLHGIFG